MANTSSSPTQNVVLLSGLFIALSIVGTYLFLIPQLQRQRLELEDKKAELTGLKADQATLTDAQEQIAAAQLQLQQKNVDFNKLGAVYPANEDMPGLYIQLENLMAQATSVGVTASYQVSNPAADELGGAKIPLSFTASGSYQNLRTFISQLENNTRPIILSTISFDQSNTDTAGQLALTATGYTKAATISSAYASTK